MIIEQALYNHLRGHPGLVALVGDRIYPLILPQTATYPAVTYRRISGPREHAYGVARPRFQISCWAKTYSQAKAVVEQVKLSLNSFSGVLGGAGGVRSIVSVQNDADFYEPDTGTCHIPVDVIILHDE